MFGSPRYRPVVEGKRKVRMGGGNPKNGEETHLLDATMLGWLVDLIWLGGASLLASLGSAFSVL